MSILLTLVVWIIVLAIVWTIICYIVNLSPIQPQIKNLILVVVALIGLLFLIEHFMPLLSSGALH